MFNTDDVVIVEDKRDNNLYLYHFLDITDPHLGNVCSIYCHDQDGEGNSKYYYTTLDRLELADQEAINNLDWGK